MTDSEQPPKEEPSEPVRPTIAYTSLGQRLAKQACSDRNLSLSKLHELTGVARGTCGDVVNCGKNAGPTTRRAFENFLGVPWAAWDKPANALDSPGVARAKERAAAPPAPPPISSTDPEASGLQIARDNLAKILHDLDFTEDESTRAKLFGAVNVSAKTIAQLSGEQDAAQLERFYLSPMFRHLAGRLAAAVADCPTCSERVERILAATVGKASKGKWEPLGFAEIATYCGRVEKHVSTDDLGPALDGIHYPLRERERELCEQDLGLAKRALAALKTGAEKMRGAPQSMPQIEESLDLLVEVLTREIGRSERFEAFERDFGKLACDRARELV